MKEDRLDNLFAAMLNYYSADPLRAQHLTKVHSYARLIGKREDVSEKEQYILEAAAYVHDIGIREAEKTLGYSNGKLQEKLGPPLAEKMMAELDFEDEMIERVSYLVSKHHTYENIEGADLQILLEADFIVNAFEDNLSKSAITEFRNKIFRTQTGIEILSTMFGLEY